jgi:ribosomal protein L12E/L44/L45/RPP1/RPP2
MTDTTNTQPVVDADATAKPVADAQTNGAGDDLDSLLAEYKASEDKAAPPPPAPQAAPQQPVADERIKRIEERFFQEDLNETVTHIFGDQKVSRRAALGWIDQVARERPAVAQAFINKERDPDTWKRIEKSLTKEAAKDFNFDVDRAVTEDVAAVAAAVRGASTKAPSEQAPNYSHMDNNEFRNELRKLGIPSPF